MIIITIMDGMAKRSSVLIEFFKWERDKCIMWRQRVVEKKRRRNSGGRK